jgi:hypothetical protein
LEKYANDGNKYGLKTAQRQFYRGLFSLLKFNLIINLNRPTIMKTQNWIPLFIFNF